MTTRLIKPEQDHLLPTEYKYGLVRPPPPFLADLTRVDETDCLSG